MFPARIGKVALVSSKDFASSELIKSSGDQSPSTLHLAYPASSISSEDVVIPFW